MRSPAAPEGVPGKSTYAGVFAVSFAAMAYEILLTRIFSVTTWYHYAFMAISIAMFGMTAGALYVYLFPRLFPPEALSSRMAASSLLLSLSLILSFAVHVGTPFHPAMEGATLKALATVALNYLAISLALSLGISAVFWTGFVCYAVAFLAFRRI